MKKAIIVLLALATLIAAPQLFAQTASGTPAATTAASTPASPAATQVGAPDASKIGVDTAQQKLKEVSVDKFQTAGFWTAFMAADDGYVQARLFEGGPAAAANEPLPDERQIGIDLKTQSKYALGVKTEFYRRGYNEIYIMATRPIPIEGITKTISIWVAGRNYNHKFLIILEDFFGRRFELPLGTLNFQGWKKLSVAVPPQNPDGVTGIVQRNFHYQNHMGLKVVGFKIECDPMEAFGTYYIYLDDMRAVTDLFAEDDRDLDDMSDSW
jgi:hypothetical protein